MSAHDGRISVAQEVGALLDAETRRHDDLLAGETQPRVELAAAESTNRAAGPLLVIG